MWENLDRVDWARLAHAYGHARDVPKMLRAMISRDEGERASGWAGFWGALNHQGDFYDSTVAAIPFLIEALGDGQVPGRAGILDALRRRWLDAPEYGGDPWIEAPPGGIDEPTPMGDGLDPPGPQPDEPEGRAEDEEFDINLYRRMDLCAWQAGRAIQDGRATFRRLLHDPDREVAAASAELLLAWPDSRPLAKRALVDLVEAEPEVAEQARRVLKFGAYADLEDVPMLRRWVAADRPLEVRVAAALTWARLVDPDPPPGAAAAALQDGTAPAATAFGRLPWEGAFEGGPWMLPDNASDYLLRLASNEDKEIRWRAAQGLAPGRRASAHLAPDRVVPVLVARLSDRYNRVRDAAAYAIGQRAAAGFAIDPGHADALIAVLEPHADPGWGDGIPSLDDGASASGHSARSLAAMSDRLDPGRRQRALEAVDRAIRHFEGKNTYVRFDSLSTSTTGLLEGQLGPIREPIRWGLRELLEAVAFPGKQDNRLSPEECDRRLAGPYLREPNRTLAEVVEILADGGSRNASIGASHWLMTLGPAAGPALAALDGVAAGTLDEYARRQAREAAESIRSALAVAPEAEASGPGSARQRAASRKGPGPSIAGRSEIAEATGRLRHPDPYVRAEAAGFLGEAIPTAGDPTEAARLLEGLLSDEAAVEVGVAGPAESRGRLYFWRRERRSPRASAIHALFAIDRPPAGGRVLEAMLAESEHPAAAFGRDLAPRRFPIGQWRRAVAEADGLGLAGPRIRAARQRRLEIARFGDRSGFAPESELGEVVRQLYGRLV